MKTYRFFWNWTALVRLLAATTVGCVGTVDARAQMKTGEQMKGYEEAFGVKVNRRHYPFSVQVVGCSAPGNVLFPGEQPTLELQVLDEEGEALDATGTLHVIAYGTRGIPGDIWLPEVYASKETQSLSVPIKIEAHGFTEVSVTPVIPESFGAYALVLDVAGRGRRFVTSLVRTFPPATGRRQYPRFSLDHLPDQVLSRLGVQAIRYNLSYVPSTSKDYPRWREQVKRELEELNAHHITVMLMFLNGTGPEGQPLGIARPHLDNQDVMLPTKQDTAWLPASDADFRKTVTELCTDYGWPKGAVTAVSLWNEPWEGISISGWGADMLRYREMYRAMAQGVDAARRAGSEVLLAGCDSSSNTLDKLFPDGSDEFLPWFDVCSVHYQGLSTPTLYKVWLDRTGPRGRVKVWDTESWIANTDDRVAVVIAGMRAAGYDRVMGVFGGNIAQPVTVSRQRSGQPPEPVTTTNTWSVAAAVGAAQHFIGEREFRELLFQNGLPWIFIFDGLGAQEDDGTVVVVGDLGEAFGTDGLPFRGVRGMAELARRQEIQRTLTTLPVDSPARDALLAKLAAPVTLSGGKLTLPSDPAFRLFDFYGNDATPKDGKPIVVPLDHRGFFLRTDGSKGAWARLRAALQESRIEGYQCLDVVVRDATAPFVRGGAVRLQLTNVLNRPVRGALKATLSGTAIDAPASLSFGAHETKSVVLHLEQVAARPDNAYPLAVYFDAGADGCVTHEETVHVNSVARRTITVDGNLDDWKGVLPQIIEGRSAGPTLTEAAWFPFARPEGEAKPISAVGQLAYDERNFYFAAQVHDTTPDPGTFRFAALDEDQFFYPAVSYELDRTKTLLATEETWDVASRRNQALWRPGGVAAGRNYVQWSSPAAAFAFDLDLPADRLTQLAFYFVDTDEYELGRRQTTVQLIDRSNNHRLAEQMVAKSGLGCYAVFTASGRVRVTFTTGNWLPPSLAGIFFDSAGPAPQTIAGPTGRFVRFDEATGPDWSQHYGRDGYRLAGLTPRDPGYARVEPVNIVARIEHHWPADVRRYSYRMRPVLPSGNAPKFDNVQIAFGVRGPGDGDMVANAPGTMPGYVAADCTDYEYALNQVAPQYGGGTEIWRLLAPGMPRKQFYPRQPKGPHDGPVKDGQLVMRREGNTRYIEAAIPWTDMPLVKQAVDQGKPVRFSFRVNDNGGAGAELAQGRSVSMKNSLAFHADWVEHWANNLEFGFEP